MTEDRTVLDRRSIPPKWPTHLHAPEFWEQLGRTVATFGFLEEALGKAIFAFTGTRRYSSLEEAETAYEAWVSTLEHALTDTLKPLAKSYAASMRRNPENTTENIDELIEEINKVSDIRNVICHGSWRRPDADGRSVPLFVNNRKEIFETPLDVASLQQVQCHVAELACTVMDTVTHMGYQFPGGAGPGKPVWTRD